MKLSLCMIVRNEEANLDRCLSSVYGVVDEIIVVDTGSTDRTKHIARQYGAIVIDHEWHDDFSEARNVSLAHATGTHIIWMDADDELPWESQDKIKAIRELGGNVAWLFTIHNVNPVSLDIFTCVQDFMHMRVFPNCGLRFEGRLHETVEHQVMDRKDIEIRVSNIVVLHHGYAAYESAMDSLQRNCRIEGIRQGYLIPGEIRETVRGRYFAYFCRGNVLIFEDNILVCMMGHVNESDFEKAVSEEVVRIKSSYIDPELQSQLDRFNAIEAGLRLEIDRIATGCHV